MEDFERLLGVGLPLDRVEYIVSARQPVKHLMLLGLPKKTIRSVWVGSESCAFKGTGHRRNVTDLRGHHLTQKRRRSNYASKDPAAVAREASGDLHHKRSKILFGSKFIPLPGETMGKQVTQVREPREAFQPRKSRFSPKVDMNNSKAVSEEDFKQMEDFYSHLLRLKDGDMKVVDFDQFDFDQAESDQNDFDQVDFDQADADQYINTGSSNHGQASSEKEVAASTTEGPDDYDIEMAKAEEEGLFEEQPEPTPQTPGLPVFLAAVNREPERQTKRKRETVSSPELPTSDLPGEANHSEKRRKLQADTDFPQVPAPGLRKKGRKEHGGKLEPHLLFLRSSALAAVAQAVEAAGAVETPQEDSPDTPELDPLDLELLGEEPSNSEQTHPSVSKDLKTIIAEEMYPLVSHDDLRVVSAAANLLDTDQGNFNVAKLDSKDREALKKAFGNPGGLQPSVHTEKIPRTVTFSDRCYINKSLMKRHGHTKKFKAYDKVIGPSKEFQSFFATRRQRTEPGARLGAEFVAKSLLDGQKSPLKRLVRDSQKSNDARRRQQFSLPEAKVKKVKKVSAKDRRKIAVMKKSGLNAKKE